MQVVAVNFMDLLILGIRVVLALVFAVAGGAKLLDVVGSRRSLEDFGVPMFLARPLALLLPLAELACAVALLVDPWALTGALGAAGLLILFVLAISLNLSRGRRPDCHCFGRLSSEPIGAATLIRNALLLALTGVILWQEPLHPSGWNSFAAFAPFELAITSAAAFLGAGLVFTLWLALHILRQNGRLLVRLEAVEKKLNIDPHSPGLPVGDFAPDFRLAALDGDPVSLEGLSTEDKPLLLIFIEPGCGACDSLLPDVGRWQRVHAGRLIAVPISRGEGEINRAKTAKHAVSGVLLQKERETAEAYKVAATPSAVWVTRGKISSAVAVGVEAIQALVAQATLPPALKKGETVPSLSLPSVDGGTVNLGSLKGRRTLLLFWSPSCGYCQAMLDDIKQWEGTRPADAPELLVISAGSVEENRQQGFRARILLDANFGAGNIFGAGGTPSAVIVNEQGSLASEVHVGGPDVLALASGAHL